MYRFVVRFGFDGDDERVGVAVHETGGQRLVLVGLGTLNAGSLPGTSKEVTAHFRLFTKHQCIQGNAVTAGYFLQHTYGDVKFSRFCKPIFFFRNIAIAGDVFGCQFQYLTQSLQTFGYLFNLFVHVVSIK